MLSIPFLLTTLLVLSEAKPNATDTRKMFNIPRNLWHCGGDKSTQDYAIKQIAQTCPRAASNINHCCAIHDDCYTNQHGQKVCDEKFCKCLDGLVASDPAAASCSSLSKQACMAVRMFGSAFYKDSANVTRTVLPEAERQVPKIEKIGLDYLALYEKCDSQNVTLASCALNFDNCVGRETHCLLSFINCVDNTKYDREKDVKCDDAINSMLRKLINAEPESSNIIVMYLSQTRKSINQYISLRSASMDSLFFVYLIVFALLCLVCSLGAIASSRINRQVAFDDLAPSPDNSVTGTSTIRN